MANSGYDVYMGNCLLPVTPEKIETKINNKNTTVTLINEGEINILKKAGLTEISFECMIPQVQQPFANYKDGFQSASYFMDIFETLKTDKTPFQFIVCRKLPSGGELLNTNIKVSLEDYKITEEAGNGFDFMVDISLKQWRDYSTKTVSITIESTKATASVETTRETSNSPEPTTDVTYTVVSGDSLWAIAKKYYGNGSQYTVIYNANKSVIGSNPNLIYPGQVLTIPSI